MFEIWFGFLVILCVKYSFTWLDGDKSDRSVLSAMLCYVVPMFAFEFYLAISPKTVTPKRTPSGPTTLSLKEETMVEMKSLTLEKLVWPTLHDSSTRNTMSACTTVLHAEGAMGELVSAQISWKDRGAVEFMFGNFMTAVCSCSNHV